MESLTAPGFEAWVDSSDGFGRVGRKEGGELMGDRKGWGGGRSVTEMEGDALVVPSAHRQRTPLAEEMRQSESRAGLKAQPGG